MESRRNRIHRRPSGGLQSASRALPLRHRGRLRLEHPHGHERSVATPLGVLQATTNRNWITTVAARFGITSDRLLVYGKIGAGWAQGSTALNVVNGGTIFPAPIPMAACWRAPASNTPSRPIGPASWNTTISGSATRPPPRHPSSMRAMIFRCSRSGRITSSATALPSRRRPALLRPRRRQRSLARASQNPIADMISLPFQNNTNFNTGPFNRTQDILNIQPVIPMKLNADWNLISRTIVPLISQPNPVFDSSTGGIGDITQSLFLSPTHPGTVIWGVGPVFTMPSASDPTLGTGKVLLGPTAVLLITPGHWVIGVLVNNQWSVAGDPNRAPVNAFLAQPFVNYNMAGGWFLTTSPIITANWNAASGQQWTLPLGGGFGRVFKVDGQAYNASVQAYYNAVGRPTRRTGIYGCRSRCYFRSSWGAERPQSLS